MPHLRSITRLAAIAILLCCQASLAEVKKWVDDQGRVHFGDTVPPEYQERAETIEHSTVNVPAPEADVAHKNQQYQDKLQREKQSQPGTSSSVPQESSHEGEASDMQGEDYVHSRSECRNLNLITKHRVACFRRADEAGKNY